jgi:hypothetical protein
MLCLAFLHFHLDSYIVIKGEKLEVCIHMFRGSFLAVFGVEFVLCLACDLSSPFFGFGHELSLFVFLSSLFLFFSEFHFALYRQYVGCIASS